MKRENTPNHIHEYYLKIIDCIINNFAIIENRIVLDFESQLLSSQDMYEMLKETLSETKTIKLDKYKI